ncbi:mucin-20 isoform X1 [Fukomys damarensis]|uniref:mucin-20 isoform X1 n=1 Tax=Fukomys damarensis TaxID=885580 RepID=UPI00053FDF51|nr:mucin-20 isoform X1 [Fukomys damarensis]
MAGAPAGMGSVCGLALPLLILCWEVGDSSDFKDTRTLTKLIPSDSMAAVTVAAETLDTSGSSMRTGETTAETRPGSDPTKAIFDTLCTDDSSEEARWITNVLTWVRTSGEAESLSSDSSFSSDHSVAIGTTSQALGPDVAVPSKALVPYSTTHIKFLRETETAAVISGTSDPDHSSTGVKALSTSKTPALPASPSPSPTSPAETLSRASTSESAAPNNILEASLPTGTTETEVTSALAPAPGGTQVTVGMGPLGETSALSQKSYTTVSGAVTVSTKAAPTEGKMTSFAGSSASVSSSSEGLTIKNSTLSETFTTEDTTSRAFPTSRSPPPPVHPTKASSRQETSVTSAKTMTSPKSSSESLITEDTISRAISTSTGLFLSVYPTTDSTQETNLTLAMTISSPKTPSKTFTTDRAFPTRSPLSPVHPTTASSSQETRVTSAVTTTSPKIPSETFITEGTTNRAFTTSSPLLSVLPTTANLSQETTVTSALTMTSPKIPSEIFTTDGTTSRAVPTSRIPPSSVLPTTVNYSQETNVTSTMTKTSPKTQRKPPTAVSATVWTRQTPEVTVGADGGFLLVRLRVASMEDLTEPTQAERLVRQLQCELQARLPPAQLSLLHIQSS